MLSRPRLGVFPKKDRPPWELFYPNRGGSSSWNRLRDGCHAFADGLQRKNTLQDHCESMQTLQSSHAFAVINAACLFCKPSAKAWHPNCDHFIKNHDSPVPTTISPVGAMLSRPIPRLDFLTLTLGAAKACPAGVPQR